MKASAENYFMRNQNPYWKTIKKKINKKKKIKPSQQKINTDKITEGISYPVKLLWPIRNFTKGTTYLICLNEFLRRFHCVKSVRIRSYSGLHFLAFGLNTGRYGLFLRILSKCGKIRARITPNTVTFYPVLPFCSP